MTTRMIRSRSLIVLLLFVVCCVFGSFTLMAHAQENLGNGGSGTSENAGNGGSGTTENLGNGGNGTTENLGNGGAGQVLKNPLKFDSLPALLDAVLKAVVDIGAIVLIFMLVWCGFLFVSAQGNPEKISSARSALIWTLIGGLILLGAEAISKVIEATVQSIT